MGACLRSSLLLLMITLAGFAFTTGLSARQIDLIDYFPHKLGDSWQYTYLDPPRLYLPGFIEIRVTGIDTLQDGTKWVYVNHLSEPRWRIDSTGVYSMPLMMKEAIPEAGVADKWPLYSDTLLNINIERTFLGLDTLTVFGEERRVARFRNRGNYFFPHSPYYIEHIGLYSNEELSYNSGWRLTGAILGGDTLGTWQPGYSEKLIDWFPVAVGNIWQYEHFNWAEKTGWLDEWRVTEIDTMPDGKWIVHINGEPRFELDFAKGEIYNRKQDAVFFRFSDMQQLYKTARIEVEYDNGFDILYRYYHDVRGGTYRDFSWTYVSLGGIRTFKKGTGWTGSPMDSWGYEINLLSYVINGDTTGRFVSVHYPETGLPGTFNLSQNYPNPFNPATTIRWSIEEAGPVRLEVFDITGRRVAVLVDQGMPAGSHVSEFNASGLASGVYLYRLETGHGSLVRKMVFAK